MNAFEHITAALHWPQDIWAILLQCKLKGSGGVCLSVDDSLSYDKVKVLFCVSMNCCMRHTDSTFTSVFHIKPQNSGASFICLFIYLFLTCLH